MSSSVNVLAMLQVPDVIRSACSYTTPACPAVSGCSSVVMMVGDCCAVCGEYSHMPMVVIIEQSCC